MLLNDEQRRFSSVSADVNPSVQTNFDDRRKWTILLDRPETLPRNHIFPTRKVQLTSCTLVCAYRHRIEGKSNGSQALVELP